MQIPNLMPYQMEPFNGDKFAEREVLFLKKKWGIKSVVETGTCLGSSTIFFAKNFERVATIESNEGFQQVAKNRCKDAGIENVLFVHGSSADVLSRVLGVGNKINGSDLLFFLDAHWGQSCPLMDELSQIASSGLQPVIMIHDFFVPGSGLGYDTYNGQRFDLDWLHPMLNVIYGGDYDCYYNSNDEAGGAMRGIIYITPKQRVNLLTYHYTSSNTDRNLELACCFNKNMTNILIDQCVHFSERKTYNQMFARANDLTWEDAKSKDITIICNSDIFFTPESIRKIKRHIRPNVCFALSRYDVGKDADTESAVLYNRPDSQDAWVFMGEIPQMEGADFGLGIPGCDNRIAYIISENGYEVLNPAHTIKSYHLHNIQHRTYNRENTVPPPYKILKLVSL